MDKNLKIRLADEDDAIGISNLYEHIYDGTYPDPLMKNLRLLRAALRSDEYCWSVAETLDQKIIASTVYRLDRKNKIAKAFGAVVLPSYRGHGVTEKLLRFGYNYMRNHSSPIEITYATTRTVSFEPQKLTKNLGYKKLGVFPNVHKTDTYETHCLTAFYSKEAIEKRNSSIALHPKLLPLFEIVRKECSLAPLPVATEMIYINTDKVHKMKMEPIYAPLFVRHRFRIEKTDYGDEWFYPFEEPNMLLTNPDQSVEAFVSFSKLDKHCVLIGIRDQNNIGIASIMSACTNLLRDAGARYVEFLIRADETEKVQAAIEAKYIPSAYFPAMQLSGDQRHDIIIFSQSFEILDFHDAHMEEKNLEYLRLYSKYWQEIALTPITPGNA